MPPTTAAIETERRLATIEERIQHLDSTVTRVTKAVEEIKDTMASQRPYWNLLWRLLDEVIKTIAILLLGYIVYLIRSGGNAP